MLKGQLIALALAATALAASGCGGSTKTQSATTTVATASSTKATPTTAQQMPPAKPVHVATGKPLTRAQLISQGDAICASANKKVDTVTVEAKGKASSPSKSEEESLQAFPRAEVFEAAETHELSKLVPPASMTHDWGLIVSDFHRYLEYAEAGVRDSEAKDVKALVSLFVPAEKVHARLNAIAKRNGFKYCSGIV